MEWINVKDRMPDKDVIVLATDGKYLHLGSRDIFTVDGLQFDYIGHDRCEDLCGTEDATHWMPLPVPPAKDK